MNTVRHTMVITLFGFSALFASTSFAAAEKGEIEQPLETELGRLIEAFDTKSVSIKELASQVKWSGISDPRLFDRVEAKLLGGYQNMGGDEGDQYYSWLAQMLAFSGQTKYRSALATVLKNSKDPTLVRHARSSLGVLPDFHRWNPVISHGLDSVPAERIGEQRAINMLNADEPQLIRAGASIVIDKHLENPRIMKVVEQRLRDVFNYAQRDNAEFVEAVAWLCKALGTSGNADYKPVLEEVYAAQTHRSANKWAKKAWRMLD